MSFACGDVVPGCDATFVGADESAILTEVASHAASRHGLTEVSPHLVAAVSAAIHPAVGV